LIEHFENSKAFSFNLDNKDESINLSSLRKHLEMNISLQDTKIDSLTQERESVKLQILQCLKNAGIEGTENIEEWRGDDVSFERVLEKLEILL